MASRWLAISMRTTLAVALAAATLATFIVADGKAAPASKSEPRPAAASTPKAAAPSPVSAPAATPRPIAKQVITPAPAPSPVVARRELVDEAMEMIEYFEGRRQTAYTDSQGNRTIGVGFNLNRQGAAADLARVLPGVSRDALASRRARLSDPQIDALLRHDTLRAIDNARRQIGNFDSLPRDVQLVLVDLCYNLGGLAKWRDLRDAVERRDFTAAASEMKDSRWYSQTGKRARATTRMMRDAAKG